MANNHTISQRKYDAANCRYFQLKYNLVTDKDIIAKLESVRSKQDYIRKLIRKDMAHDANNKKED